MCPAWCVFGCSAAPNTNQVRQVPPLSSCQAWTRHVTVVTATSAPLRALWLKPAVGPLMVQLAELEEVWRSPGVRPHCGLVGVPCCWELVAGLRFCFPASVCLPGQHVLALLLTPCLSLFAFLCVKKCHVKALGAGNVLGAHLAGSSSPALSLGDEERRVPAR